MKVSFIKERESGFKLQIEVDLGIRKHLYRGLFNRITDEEPQLKGKEYSLVVRQTWVWNPASVTF